MRRWLDDLLRLLRDDSDPLGVDDFATHRVLLEDGPRACEIFQKKEHGALKILLQQREAATRTA